MNGVIRGHLAVLLCVWLAMVARARGDESDLPADAPNDSIMAAPADVEGMFEWASMAFAGQSERVAAPSFMDVTPSFSFRYDGADSAELLKTWTRAATNVDEKDRLRQEVVWTDPKTGLRVTAAVTGWKRYPDVEWVLHFENQGTQDTPIIENIQALDTGLRTDSADRPVVVHGLVGDVCRERSFLTTEATLEPGKPVSMAPEGGRPSSGAFPFFNIQYGDQGVIAAIGWTGQWAATLERLPAGTTRVRAGMAQTHLTLHPGERIRSPRILLMTWKGDRLSAHQRFRRLLMFHYAPKQNGRPLRLPLALQGFDRYVYYRAWPEYATEAGQMDAVKAASELGCDTLWLDAAWFPGGYPKGVGNWYPDPKGYPGGLRVISDAAHKKGLRFLLWFEPEHAYPNTQVVREHPEFVFGGAQGGLFKLNEQVARQWLTDLLSQRIKEYAIDVFRSDFNIGPLAYWRQNDTADRQGITEIRYVEGLYAMWDDLRARHPGLWIDNCASGGRRMDLEACMRSVTLWRSDTGCDPGNADWDQTQTLGLCQYLPLFGGGNWSPAAYDIRSAATAGAEYEFDFHNENFPVSQARAAVAEVKENQKYWYGDFYPLTPASLASDQWVAYQFHRADLNAGIVLAFRRSAAPASYLPVKLGGVDPEVSYVVEFSNEVQQKAEEVISGRELASKLELRLPNPRSSLLVRYRPAQAQSQ